MCMLELTITGWWIIVAYLSIPNWFELQLVSQLTSYLFSYFLLRSLLPFPNSKFFLISCIYIYIYIYISARKVLLIIIKYKHHYLLFVSVICIASYIPTYMYTAYTKSLASYIAIMFWIIFLVYQTNSSFQCRVIHLLIG